MRSIIGSKLASLHELTNLNTVQAGRPFLFRDLKYVSISILFQKVCLGWKLSPTINRRELD